MMYYCEACGREADTKIISRKEVFKVCGEDIEVNAEVMVCSKCGEELCNEKLDSASLVEACNEYRRRHKLLLPEEITKIRKQYGLSQRSFAKLLNWGDKTIRRYEKGDVQDRVHNSLLLFLRKPENMRTYLTDNEVSLEEKQIIRLLKKVEELKQDANFRDDSNFDLFFSRIPCEENGFKGFDYKKLCAMILFFAHKSTGLLKTKLMKLLNYSDMIFYKENGLSITGLKYAHLPYGPGPEHFDMILGMMTADHIAHIEVFYDNSYEIHQVIPEREVPEGVLSDKEIEVLTRVYEKFKNFGSAEISNYSHNETGYKATKPGQIISYAYAADINLD